MTSESCYPYHHYSGFYGNEHRPVLIRNTGSFIGDMLFYPLPMFVSLVTHGLQAVVISYISHSRILQSMPKLASGIGVTIGGTIMVAGYTLGKIFVYSTFEYVMIKLPYEIAQAVLGAAVSMILYWKYGLGKHLPEYVRRQ